MTATMRPPTTSGLEHEIEPDRGPVRRRRPPESQPDAAERQHQGVIGHIELVRPAGSRRSNSRRSPGPNRLQEQHRPDRLGPATPSVVVNWAHIHHSARNRQTIAAGDRERGIPLITSRVGMSNCRTMKMLTTVAVSARRGTARKFSEAITVLDAARSGSRITASPPGPRPSQRPFRRVRHRVGADCRACRREWSVRSRQQMPLRDWRTSRAQRSPPRRGSECPSPAAAWSSGPPSSR